MSQELSQYLDKFAAKAGAAGLAARKPGNNWVPLAPLVRGSHISLSVAKRQIQINLNNDDDADRHKFEALFRDRQGIEQEIGEGLIWEKKDGRKKTAIRATLDRGYADADWSEQHAWALGMMQKFERSFGARLT